MKRKVKGKGLRGLGTVLHIVDHKLIVKGGGIKVERLINSIVMTEEKRKIGKVYDVFGPVDRPYLSIKVFEGVKEEELKRLAHKNKKIVVL
jgi:RNA-binding protein